MKRPLAWISMLAFCFGLQANEEEPPKNPPTVATFSIVAIDETTGEIGVAVQSKIIGVGAIVPFVDADSGAIATQAFANVEYGPKGLKLLKTGATPEDAVKILTKNDLNRERRQVGIVSIHGEVATFTGKECHDWAGGIAGKGFVVQGNILEGEPVVTEMAKAFETTEGTLAERMIAALEAGQAAGGDVRGRQSAALLIERKGWGYGGLNDRFRDIRVDEHPTPIKDLRRIYKKHCELFPRPDSDSKEETPKENAEKILNR